MIRPHSQFTLSEIIHLQKYPIQNLSTQSGWDLVQHCRNQLATDGYCTLRAFITSAALALALAECEALSPLAQYTVRYTNPYKTHDDPAFPSDHPVRSFALRSNAFIPQSKFHQHSLFLVLYHSQIFKQFIAACLNQTIIYEYADTLGGLVLNILRTEGQHPWHFDENDFSIVLMICAAQEGGTFEIVPHIRTMQTENFEQVGQVLKGKHSGVRQIQLQPGDLHIFRGRLSLHRVTTVVGKKERLTVVFSYTQNPGVTGRVENNTQIFDQDDH